MNLTAVAVDEIRSLWGNILYPSDGIEVFVSHVTEYSMKMLPAHIKSTEELIHPDKFLALIFILLRNYLRKFNHKPFT